MNITSQGNNASRIVMAAREATSVDLPSGAAVHGIGGTLWLTQEGDQRDHVLPAGTTFCTDRSGRVVLSAIENGAVALVRDKAPSHCVPGTVTIDSIRRVTREAELAQARYVANAFVRAGDWLVAALRRAVHASTGSARTAVPGRPEPVEGRPRAFRGFVRSH